MVATTKPVDIGKLITRTPEIWHGLPVITGTRITVMGIITLHLVDGLGAAEIARGKELTLAQVYAALAYYYANLEQMDNEIAEEQNAYDRLVEEAQHASGGT